jgi:hypothetical protein
MRPDGEPLDVVAIPQQNGSIFAAWASVITNGSSGLRNLHSVAVAAISSSSRGLFHDNRAPWSGPNQTDHDDNLSILR